MSKLIPVLFVLLLVAFAPGDASGFGDLGGACESDCMKCHQITLEEASEIVREVNPEIEVLNVELGPVGGLWELTIRARGIKSLAYIDFAKKHIITGSVLEVQTRKNLTSERLYEINKADFSSIPLEEALVLGNAEAEYRAIIFTDPDCPYCRKLHKEMKEIVKEREDIAFFIKMFPLKTHPGAYRKSKSIVCEKSLWLLERAFDGRKIREPRCETTEIDDNIELAKKLGVTGTPSIILPDGGIIPGFKDAESLVELIESATEQVRAEEGEPLEEAVEEPAYEDAPGEGYEKETGAYGDLEEDESAEGEAPEPEVEEDVETEHITDAPAASPSVAE
jgi:thiol:disulfide interchange protein DsbC